MRRLARRLVVPALLAVTTAALATQQPRATFPHALHAKLFLSCNGCHGGILAGDSTRMFPPREVCAQCHNGTDVRIVNWSYPTWRVTNLKFSHAEHASTSARAGSPVQCASCHGQESGRDTTFMHVAGANPEACIACHQHRAPEHMAASADCATCHKTVAQATNLTVAMIAAFPKPTSHADPEWVSHHAPANAAQLAQCAICHARESCERCHVNADAVPAIQSLARDERVASLVRNVDPVYFTPASHRASSWAYAHGGDARANTQTCATCHAQTSCRTCHIGTLGSDVIAKLSDPQPGRASGVVLYKATPLPGGGGTSVRATNAGAVMVLAIAQDTVRAMMVHVHPDGFATNHKSAAASGQLNCQGCHQPRDCTACHDGVSNRAGYHPADFMSRHATSAYAQDQTCSTCHRVETFCRACHQKSGIANTGGVRGTAHNGQPLWLLQHGQAARQGLTGCTSCHQQRDCLRCHSSLGLHVNPHGPDFNAGEMGAKNMQMCLVCHLTDPLKK